ncbi:MAG: 4Fe-4S binding protein, partial [bacterium]
MKGRFFPARLFFVNRNCDGCGICAANCPVGAIRMQGKDDHQWPFWRYNCESCMKCAAFCPKNAIEAGHSWGVLLGLILFWPAAAWLVTKLSTWIYRIMELAGFYLVLTLSYM